MKQKLLTNWNFTRILYVVIGVTVIGQSLGQREWIGTALGIYLTAMGVFAFGCAAGNCAGGSCEVNDGKEK